MKKEMSAFALVLAAVLLLVYLFNLNLTGFAVFEQTSDLANGVYDNTMYDSGSVVLNESANATSGSYTSVILDAGVNSTWNNLSWSGIVPENSTLSFQVTSCSDENCSDASFNDVSSDENNTIDLTGLSLTQFIMYKVLFSRDSLNDSSPSLTDVSYSYSSEENQTQEDQGPMNTSASISSPSGTYDDGSGIPINYTVEGTNLTCKYSVEDSSGGFTSNVTLADCEDSTFSLAGDEDYVFHLYVDGALGSVHETSSFTLNANPGSSSTSTETTTQTSSESEAVVIPTSSLSGSVTSPVLLDAGSSQDMTFDAQNTGTRVVGGCELSATGDYASWVSASGDSKGIGVQATVQFPFTVSVPQGTEEGSYNIGLSVDCSQASTSGELVVNIAKPKLGAEILSSERTRSNRVRVIYTLSELTGEAQDVQVYFGLLDAENTEVANASENRTIGANETQEFSINIPINESLEGNLSLSGSFNSQVYSSTVLEPISLGAPIGGFAVFGDVGAGSIIVVLVVLVIFVALFFVVRKLRKTSSGGFKSLFKRSSGNND